jgi:polysaccharide biosynthesis transport protein
LISSRPTLPIPAPEPVYSIPPPPSDEETSGGGMSPAQAVAILRAYRSHAIIAIVALVCLSGAIIKLLPKVYVATATLIVNYDNKDALAGREFPAGEASTFVPTQIELIMSPVILRPVAQHLKLNEDSQFTRGFVGPPNAVMEVVTKNLQKALQVQQGVGSQLLYISAAAKDPDLAANIANSVVDEYLLLERRRTNEPAGARAERYSQQLAELREKAVSAQDRLTEFRQANGLTEVDGDRVDLEGSALADLQIKLEAAQNQRRDLESRQLDTNAKSDAVLDSTAIVALRARLQAQEAQMAELRATLGPKHPKVQELSSQMEATRRSLADEVSSISTNNSVQLARARELESKYASALQSERTRLLQRRAVQDQSAKLVLELQSAQATYKRALDGYDQIVFASAGNYTDVSLVSRADPPVKAEKPNKVKLFLVGIALSFALGLAGPFAYELFVNRRLRCRDDLERHFGIPVLAQLDPIAAAHG